MKEVTREERDAIDAETRFTWEYVDTVREFAERMGSVNEAHVQKLIAKLEAGARARYGERPK